MSLVRIPKFIEPKTTLSAPFDSYQQNRQILAPNKSGHVGIAISKENRGFWSDVTCYAKNKIFALL